jgi:hypothetical protein
MSEHLIEFANNVRATLGKKPVKRLRKGVPGSTECCVLARTIGSEVSVNYNDIVGNVEVEVDSPFRPPLSFNDRAVVKWLYEFDAGLHPEFEEK